MQDQALLLQAGLGNARPGTGDFNATAGIKNTFPVSDHLRLSLSGTYKPTLLQGNNSYIPQIRSHNAEGRISLNCFSLIGIYAKCNTSKEWSVGIEVCNPIASALIPFIIGNMYTMDLPLWGDGYTWGDLYGNMQRDNHHST